MRSTVRQIIALGGGGFSMEPENPALDLYVLEQAATTRPKVCFLPTASGDSERYILNFYTAFARYDCQPTHLSLFGRGFDFRAFVLQQDVIYVGGGNTKSMLGLWREWGLGEILREAWQEGVVLAGISAGAICWFEQGVTDSWAEKLSVLSGLGFLPGSCCPHYDSEAERRPAFHGFLSRREVAAGHAVEDGAALHFQGEELARVVTSRPEARAFRVQVRNGSVREEALPATYLGGR